MKAYIIFVFLALVITINIVSGVCSVGLCSDITTNSSGYNPGAQSEFIPWGYMDYGNPPSCISIIEVLSDDNKFISGAKIYVNNRYIGKTNTNGIIALILDGLSYVDIRVEYYLSEKNMKNSRPITFNRKIPNPSCNMIYTVQKSKLSVECRPSPSTVLNY